MRTQRTALLPTLVYTQHGGQEFLAIVSLQYFSCHAEERQSLCRSSLDSILDSIIQ